MNSAENIPPPATQTYRKQNIKLVWNPPWREHHGVTPHVFDMQVFAKPFNSVPGGFAQVIAYKYERGYKLVVALVELGTR